MLLTLMQSQTPFMSLAKR